VVSVFALQWLGVFDAAAGDLLAVPMTFAGAAVQVAKDRIMMSAVEVPAGPLARPARRRFARA
jgi:hypothetical protein